MRLVIVFLSTRKGCSSFLTTSLSYCFCCGKEVDHRLDGMIEWAQTGSMELLEAVGYDYIYRPGSGQRTLLLFHGTGGGAEEMVDLGQMIEAEASLVAINGQAMEGTARRFFARQAEGVYDLADLSRRTKELALVIAAIGRRHALHTKQLWGIGYSNGANILASLLLSQPKLLQQGILLRPLLPEPPLMADDLSGSKVWLLHGQADPLSSLEQTERLAARFKDRGGSAMVELIGAGHGLTEQDIESIRAILQGRS